MTPAMMCGQGPSPYWMKSMVMSGSHHRTGEEIENHRQHDPRDNGAPKRIQRIFHGCTPEGTGFARADSSMRALPLAAENTRKALGMKGLSSGRQAARADGGDRLGAAQVRGAAGCVQARGGDVERGYRHRGGAAGDA